MQTICYFILFIFVFTLYSAKNNYKQTERSANISKKESKDAVCAFRSDTCVTSQNDYRIELFDTTDCVFKIYTNNRNFKSIKARVARFDQNAKEISFNTIDLISKNDSSIRSESYYNPMIGLGFCKEYSDGQLKACGFEINKGKVGKWKYYSAAGELDSIVDHSSHWGMTYCEFFEIARAFGMIGENSSMPNRKKFFEVADSLGLKNDNPNITYFKPNWVNYDFYPIPEEEKNGRYSCEITYSNNSAYREWTVGKFFRIGNKSLCFYLSVLPETKDVKIHECWSTQ